MRVVGALKSRASAGMLGFSARDERRRVAVPDGEERETPEGHHFGSERLTFRARGTRDLAGGVGDQPGHRPHRRYGDGAAAHRIHTALC